MKTAIDLFCGSGAVTLGLKKAGFRVLAAVDMDPLACATYRSNHPEVHLLEEDIVNVDPNGLRPLAKGGLDLLVVCAPCQPFSNRNRFRSSKDQRVGLVLKSLSFINALQPELVFFENVPGFGSQPVFKKLEKGLLKAGYFLEGPHKVDAAQFGVPQRRHRMVLLGGRNEKILRESGRLVLKDGRLMTVRHAIGDLPEPPVRVARSEDPLHFARRHAEITIQRLRHIPHDGGGRESLPEKLRLACHSGLKKNSFPDSYGRMKWNDVAPTLTTGCNDLTKGRYAHPEQDRAITLREAARLQSFPDDYIFKGNGSQVAAQIGNAVPPQMMAAIAGRFSDVLPETTSGI